MIVGLFPELSTIGGVQRAGRLTAAALSVLARGRSDACTFLSLNDPAGTHTVILGDHELSFVGFGRSKRSFATAAWQAAGRSPSLVVALHPNLAPIAAAMKFRSSQTRTVAFAHGIEVWKPLNLLRRESLKRCDLVLAPSSDTVLHLIQQQHLNPGKVGRLPWSLGPESSRYPIPPKVSDCAEGFPAGRIVLTVGRWDAEEAYKGVDHLIAALPQLLPSVPDMHLVAVGGGTDLPRLRQLADASGAKNHIHFLPFLPPEKLQVAYERCDVFALPSRGEGFGLVFVEAMSHGKPVIGGAHGGIPDVVEEGVCGFLVEYGAVSRLADALRILLTDETVRRRMGEAARQNVWRRFTFNRFAAELGAVLDSLSRETHSTAKAL